MDWEKIFARHLCNKELIQYYLRNIHNLKYFLKDLKMDKGVEQTFLQRYINSQQAYEKVYNLTTHEENANKNTVKWGSPVAQWVKNLTAAARVSVEVRVPSPDPAQWVKGCSFATALGQMVTVAPIQSLAQELLYTAGASIKRKNKNKKAQ